MDKISILEKTGLNWGINKEKLYTGGGLEIPDKIALVRSDNQTVIGVLGHKYEPFGNDELLELLFQINKSIGLEIDNGGSFNDGGKVYIQLKSDDLHLGDDTIKGFVTGINSFDGSTSLAFGNSTLTISCMNTFWKACKQLDSKLKHTVSMRPRIDEILKGIDGLLNEEQNDFKTIKRMHETQIKEDKIKDLAIKIMFKLTEDETKLRSLISSRKTNQIDKFENAWSREIAEKGNNLWGAMSAITRFTTHDLHKDPKRGQLNKMFGQVGDNERIVWNKLSLMAS